MGRYEQVVHCPAPSHLQLKIPLHSCVQRFSHHDGNLATLKNWKECLSERLPATDIIKSVRRGMIRSALLINIALPEWIVDGEIFGERWFELEYDGIVVKIVGIRERLSKLGKEEIREESLSPESLILAKELDEEARVLDLALQEWTSRFAESWVFQHFVGTTCIPHERILFSESAHLSKSQLSSSLEPLLRNQDPHQLFSGQYSRTRLS